MLKVKQHRMKKLKKKPIKFKKWMNIKFLFKNSVTDSKLIWSKVSLSIKIGLTT